MGISIKTTALTTSLLVFLAACGDAARGQDPVEGSGVRDAKSLAAGSLRDAGLQWTDAASPQYPDGGYSTNPDIHAFYQKDFDDALANG